MKKGALQISFGWLFAIIVGIFIIFLAIYGVTRLMKTEQTALDAETGEEIDVLLNPLETSFESAKTTSFTMPTESRLYNDCTNVGTFGEQLMKVSQKNFNQWTETNLDISFENKYIFSEDVVEGTTFYVFSKPFEFPFKVADLIYLTSSKDIYCFVDAPSDIEEELNNLNQKNILTENCSEKTINVCFSGNCDINVEYSKGEGYVSKDEKIYFASDALMYAAIFGDGEIYECQLRRLMQRVEILSLIYRDKSIFIGNHGCETEISSDLAELKSLADNLNSSSQIFGIQNKVDELDKLNDAMGQCRLW